MKSNNEQKAIVHNDNQPKNSKFKLGRAFWIVLGCIGLGVGAVGAVLPMLPAFPFLLLAAFSFGKSSERLHKWFIGTKLYKNNLESYVKGQGMTWATKIKVMVTVTLLMAFGFFMMFRKDLYIPCGILGAVWLFHIVYFLFFVKLKKQQSNDENKAEEAVNEIEPESVLAKDSVPQEEKTEKLEEKEDIKTE
ncbi:MAG: YbaN family protein [Clostridia bacterium]|nr:YbaN family protein [Clostridia bacterium]